MEDSSFANDRDTALELGKMLRDHKGGAVTVLDLSKLNAWTDFFVIATVTSSTHQAGLQKHLKEFAQERGVEILRRQRKSPSDDEWSLIDLGSIVVHLMTAKSRAFYELERLWGDADVVWRDGA